MMRLLHKHYGGMVSKHIISIRDMVDDTEVGIMPTDTQSNEKIGDMINYLHLLEGIFIASQPAKITTAALDTKHHYPTA